jgi:hypothetical protein
LLPQALCLAEEKNEEQLGPEKKKKKRRKGRTGQTITAAACKLPSIALLIIVTASPCSIHQHPVHRSRAASPHQSPSSTPCHSPSLEAHRRREQPSCHRISLLSPLHCCTRENKEKQKNEKR